MRVRITKRARRDADDIFFHIAADKPRAAESMIDEIEIAIAGLADFPEIGRPLSGGLRELTTPVPYVVIYALRGSVVVILRILHGARRR